MMFNTIKCRRLASNGTKRRHRYIQQFISYKEHTPLTAPYVFIRQKFQVR